MIRTLGEVEFEVRDEPAYTINSTDNPRHYNNEYTRAAAEGYFTSAYGIYARKNGIELSSAIVFGSGGATRVHENSIAQDGTNLYICAGDTLYSLSLPALELNWALQVDIATCFAVYWLERLGLSLIHI